MKFFISTFIICFCLIFACGTESAGHTADTIPETHGDQNPVSPPARAHIYPDSITCPEFFRTLISVHGQWFLEQHHSEFLELCAQHDLDVKDSINQNTFATIYLIHELLSSRSAANCSKGEILDLPYYWHWVTPNPRHEIRFVSTGKLLSESKPAPGYEKYRSYADIDRTPHLFIADMLSEKKKYYAPGCDSFSGFGWCSEREMAAVALLDILGYKGKVVAENNHSWSEYIVSMKKTDGKPASLRVKVDNTFYSVNWYAITMNEITLWQSARGKSALAKWYNSKANSESEISMIRKIVIPASVSSEIERRVRRFRGED